MRNRQLTLLFLVFLCIVEASPIAQSVVNVQSSPFASPVSRLAWAGNAAATSCNTKCMESCFVSAAAGAHWGDAGAQRTDVCLGSCGCGAGAETVFAITSGGSARVSADAGSTWGDLKQHIPSSVMQNLPYQVRSIHVSHVDARVVVLLTNVTTSLLSTDGGKTWRPLKVGTKGDGEEVVTAWQWHPSKRDWALALTRCRSHRSHDDHRVFYTLDGGVTWKLFLEHAVQCQWAALPGGDPHRVVATASQGDGSLVELIASEDFMKSRQTLLGKELKDGPQGAVKVHVHFSFMLAVVPELSPDGSPVRHSLALWLRSEKPVQNQSYASLSTKGSHQGVDTTGFNAVSWPVNMRPPRAKQLRNLEVLYSSEHELLFYMPSQDRSLPWGHIFRCNALSAEAELVLSNVHKPNEFVGPQWRAVAGLDGVFLANRVIVDKGQDLDTAEASYDQQAADIIADREAARMDDTGATGREDEPEQDDGANRFAGSTYPTLIRSYLSVDAGRAWQPLREVRPDAGTESQTTRGRSLHLAHWISSVAAPAVLLGVGNVGLQLSENQEHRSVYVSRDAGLSWTPVLSGMHHVALLSHGDAFVAVPSKTSGLVKYSTDSGRTWRDVPVSDMVGTDRSFKGLYVHPSHTDWQLFLAIGSDATRAITFVTLDFSNVLSASCKMAEAMDPTSDFERWSPADALEDAHASKRSVCFNGVKTFYVRRKAERQCKTSALRLNPLELRNDAPCLCTLADWACDHGFARMSYRPDVPCEPLEIALQPNISTLCAATTNDHVQVTRGYVKVPGNRCEGGMDFAPRIEVCVDNTGFSGMLRRISVQNRNLSYWVPLLSVVVIAFHVMFGRRRKQEEGLWSVGSGGGYCETPSVCLLPSRIFGSKKPWWHDADDSDEEKAFLINGHQDL